ncbi:hypothetical protein K501DRAFT_202218 [Backusella circina FSU 941]|nr:hypothetical protein K501DRAFT_202218 [Backusella circina FSU 941]
MIYIIAPSLQCFECSARDVYRKGPNITHSESNYSDILLYPCLRSLVSQYEEVVTFIAGEEPLESMSKQQLEKYCVDDNRNVYKADGIVMFHTEEEFETEVLILETLSSFKKVSNTKKLFDYHKDLFGMFSILKTLADEYPMGGIQLFSLIKVYFR